MLSKQQIIDLLKEDANWEPDEDAPQEVWEMFDDVYQMLEDQGLLGINASKESEDDDDEILTDNDFDWDDDDMDDETD